MSQTHAERRSPDVVDFEGSGDEARGWLDTVVRHHAAPDRADSAGSATTALDHGSVAFDHVTIDAGFAFDPTRCRPWWSSTSSAAPRSTPATASRTGSATGESVLTSGWDMPFAGRSDGSEIRATAFTAEAVSAAVGGGRHPTTRGSTSPSAPTSRARRGGRPWRATVDQLSAMLPGDEAPHGTQRGAPAAGPHPAPDLPQQRRRAPRRSLELDRDSRDATPSTVRRAARHHRGARRRRTSASASSPRSAG